MKCQYTIPISKILRVTVLCLFFLCICSIPILTFSEEWIALEGVIRSTGSCGLILITEHGDAYTITGQYLKELNKLIGVEVQVAGKKVTSFQTYLVKGNIEISDYSVVGKGFFLGNLRSWEGQLVLVGEDNVIYKLTNINSNQAKKLLDSTIVIKGVAKKHWWKKYSAILSVEYCIYVKPASYSLKEWID